MKLSELSVEVRDLSLTRQGMIRNQDLNMSATLLYSNVGSWSLTLPREHPMCNAMRTPGSGIVCYGPKDTLFSGPTTKISFSASSNDPHGTFTFDGATDDIVLADSLAYPQPSNPNPTTQTLAHDVRSGAVEDLMRAYVNANVGPGAPAARRGVLAKKLVLPASLGRGPSTKFSARFNNLGELLYGLAITADLGFRVVQRNATLSYEVYAVADRTREIRLDLWNNTIASESLSITAPTATQVIVAGDGQQTARAFFTETNATATAAEAAWGRRIEYWVDQRQTDDVTVYKQAADQVLAEQGLSAVSVQLTPMSDDTMSLGRDWGLGDRVSVIADDQEYVSPATGLILVADANSGLRLGALLGDPASLSDNDAALKKLTSTAKRVSALERAQ